MENSWANEFGRFPTVYLSLDPLGVNSSVLELSGVAKLDVLLSGELGETPVVRDHDVLPSREFILGSAESLDDLGLVLILGADGDQILANVDSCGNSVGLSECVSHTSLETIGSCTRQHLVDTQDVVRVSSDSDVVSFLARMFDHVLVHSDTGSFESLGSNLLEFSGDQVNAKGKFIHVSPLGSDIINSDLGIGNTPQVSRLDIGLVLLVAITAGRSSSHFNAEAFLQE